jgi:hypothetical protein
MKQFLNFKYFKLNRSGFFLPLLFVLALFSGCTEDLADPPEIRVFVDNVETKEASVTGGQNVEYRFEINANTTIADLKIIIFDVLTPSVKTPKQTLVAGLTNKLNEVVTGTMVARVDTEIMLIVKDIDGNEVSDSFLLTVE